MAELKYTYALDKNENCIGIGNAQKGIEYRCPHCKGEMDVKELKTEYARCELGDGYFYDIESDELKKVKFLKA